MRKMMKFGVMMLIAAIATMLQVYATDALPIPRLDRSSAASFVVEGTSYRCLMLPVNMLPSFELKSGNKWVPMIKGAKLIVWSDSWKRLFDGNSSAVKPVIEEKPDGLYVRFTENNGVAECSTLYVFKPESVEMSYTVKLKKDIGKVRRAAVEINPEWDIASGNMLSYTKADGSASSVKIPTEPTLNNKYESLLSASSLTSVKLDKMNNLTGAGFEIRGTFDANFEQSGKALRWHSGLTNSTAKEFKAGETINVKLTMALTKSNAVTQELKSDIEVDAGKPSCRISPNVFGIQMVLVGYGKKTSNMRHPYQNNFKFDAEARQYAVESGASFFRTYLHVLYDVLGGGGSDTKIDPICPSENAPCNYTKADSFMEGLRDAGIEMMPCVGLYCPPWLSSQRPSAKYSGLWIIHRAPPKDNAKWAAIIAGLVKYWNVEKKWGVKLWMIGNEPDNRDRYWVGGTVQEFNAYFNTAAKAMKAVDPSIRISAPDLGELYAKAWPDDKIMWKDEFVKACKNDLDSLAFNCYGVDNLTRHFKDARETMAVNGAAGKELFLGEYNITSSEFEYAAALDFRGAAFLARSMKSIMENGVERASFFSWDEKELGMLECSSSGRIIPRPTYHAFRMHAALGRLKNGTVLQSSSSSDKLTVFSSKHDDGMGYTVVITSENPLFDKVQARLKLKPLHQNSWVKVGSGSSPS